MVPRNNSAGHVFVIFHFKLHHVANMRVGRLRPWQPVNPGLPEKTDWLRAWMLLQISDLNSSSTFSCYCPHECEHIVVLILNLTSSHSLSVLYSSCWMSWMHVIFRLAFSFCVIVIDVITSLLAPLHDLQLVWLNGEVGGREFGKGQSSPWGGLRVLLGCLLQDCALTNALAMLRCAAHSLIIVLAWNLTTSVDPGHR